MEKIERPKEVSKLDKQTLTKKNFEENTDKQFNKIYDYLDEMLDKISKLETMFSEVLWENSSTTSEFKGQTINLKKNNYKYFRIFYYTSNSGHYEFSQVIEPGKEFHASFESTYTPSGEGHLAVYSRRYCSSTQNSITFTGCHNANTNSIGILTDNNANVIPIKVVGFN